MTGKEMSTNSSSGERIKLLRRGRGLTQEDLAGLSGLGLATIQRAERGDRLSPDTIASLAAAFGVDATEITMVENAVENRPYLPLAIIISGRQLLEIIGKSNRMDFDFFDLKDLDQAEKVELLQSFCEPLGADRVPPGALARMKLEMEAQEILISLTSKELIVSGATFPLTCYDVDEEGFGGMPILDGQWDEVCGVLRVSPRGAPVMRAYVMEKLGKWETPGDGVIHPARSGDDDDLPTIFGGT